MMTDKKLYRSTKNRMIAGVAGGFAEFFNLDANLIRIILVAAGLAGPGIPFYLIAWLILPEDNNI